ncbi:MAG TPA: serine hydrolase domain-containing protein, partial [Gemmataceae bacterium]
LTPFIETEVKDKRLPALSIALVDDQRVVWARGFGFARPASGEKATAETVYRVGSVSKLFTDLAVMRLVEQGKLDLDAPVAKYLPDFRPENPFDKPVTLRQLMAHRSGLVREPPVGNYFDPDNPSLAETVASLNRTKLVYEPEKRIKYSNAAIATVGYVLEKTQGEPFPRYLKRTLLEPLGMRASDFVPSDAVKPALAEAVMWTYHGRVFPAPTFELGMAPAGSLYTTVLDLSKFLHMLFAGGKSGGKQIVKPETLEEMMTLQFAKPDDKEGFGIGFSIGELQGRKRIGHGGAIYGFATALSAVPSEKLGVVVVASKDVANAVTDHIARVALEQMLAVKQGKDLPQIERTTPLSREEARKWAGRYRSGEKYFDLHERDGRLWLLRDAGNYRMELRKSGEDLMVDDVVAHGTRLKPVGDKLRLGDDVYERVDVPLPPEPPAHWKGLIGEYGWDHNTLTILEKDGKLHALIEWFFLYPLKEESEDVYAFPDYGLYHGEKLIFRRDPSGRATEVEAAEVVFKRRAVGPEDGRTFS